jgi:hypothetical protein
MMRAAYVASHQALVDGKSPIDLFAVNAQSLFRQTLVHSPQISGW